jgi:hypothetical protein
MITQIQHDSIKTSIIIIMIIFVKGTPVRLLKCGVRSASEAKCRLVVGESL